MISQVSCAYVAHSLNLHHSHARRHLARLHSQQLHHYHITAIRSQVPRLQSRYLCQGADRCHSLPALPWLDASQTKRALLQRGLGEPRWALERSHRLSWPARRGSRITRYAFQSLPGARAKLTKNHSTSLHVCRTPHPAVDAHESLLVQQFKIHAIFADVQLALGGARLPLRHIPIGIIPSKRPRTSKRPRSSRGCVSLAIRQLQLRDTYRALP